MCDLLAVKTIRTQIPSLTGKQCKQKVCLFLKVLNKSLPNGGKTKDTYFVMPGMEHVTKNQPIGVFIPSESGGEWILTTTDQFLLPVEIKQ